jgi:UDP-N-acetylglucosamine/UDP-N-acetylgalactosamine 4-epimerase
LSSKIQNKKILITGGAGFIGSNLCEYFLKNNTIVCLDNFSTGFKKNIEPFLQNPNFTFIEGDIRDLATCEKAVKDVDYVLHHAALGSVPRSIENPITSNEVNVSGFLNMLVASKNAHVKRFVYAASSSTYGDSESLPKVEHTIGKPLSPYAITKYVNELYADVFSKTYGIDCVGLRYFNVFGKNQSPNGAYAAAIPKFIGQFLRYESPVIHGEGNFSRDFTYIDNVIQMNELVLQTQNKDALNEVYNTAFGEQTSLKELVHFIKSELSLLDNKIANVAVVFGSERIGDIPHSLADISKAKKLLGYHPKYSLKDGLKEAIPWYWQNLKIK